MQQNNIPAFNATHKMRSFVFQKSYMKVVRVNASDAAVLQAIKISPRTFRRWKNLAGFDEWLRLEFTRLKKRFRQVQRKREKEIVAQLQNHDTMVELYLSRGWISQEDAALLKRIFKRQEEEKSRS